MSQNWNNYNLKRLRETVYRCWNVKRCDFASRALI